MIGDIVEEIGARTRDALDEAGRAVLLADTWAIVRDLAELADQGGRPLRSLDDLAARLGTADRLRLSNALATLAGLLPADDPEGEPNP